MERNEEAGFEVGRANKPLNRYDDILPYDQTRVVLRQNDTGTDYINASHITNVLPGMPPVVASQGPLKNTLRDFWHMILQERIQVIAMVTNLIERRESKCVKYWPEMGEELTIGSGALEATVELKHELAGQAWTQRELLVVIKKTQERRSIFHYHFTDWPDHGVPSSARSFINYVRMLITKNQQVLAENGINSLPAPRGGLPPGQLPTGKVVPPPLLAHCSAGIGRTGTFVGLFAVLQSLQYMGTEVNTINVMDVVRRMRQCRQFLVQSLSQYEFLYDTIQQATEEYLQTAIESPAAASPPPVHPSVLRRTKPRNLPSVRGRPLSIVSDRDKRRRAPPPPQFSRCQHLDDLVGLLSNPSFPIMEALNQSVPMKDLDPLVNSLVKMFGAQGLLLPFASRVAEWEVDACEGPKMVFRRNSLASKLTTACLHLYGSSYLRRTLKPIIDKMLETPNMSYEINPQMLEPGQNMGENRHTLRHLTENIFASILSTLPQIPTAINLTCYGIARATHRRFPEATHAAVGGIIFLRFLCPALVSPASHNIVTEPLPPRVLRGLVLASKILQSVANSGSKFSGFREQYMQCMNKFVSSLLIKGEEFLKAVATKPSVLDALTIKRYIAFEVPLNCRQGTARDLSILGRNRDGSVGGGMLADETQVLLKLLKDHKDKVLAVLAERGLDSIAAELNTYLSKTLAAGASLPPIWVKPTEVEANRRASWCIELEFDASSSCSEVEEFYPDSSVRRAQVQFFSWNVLDRTYAPVEYTHKDILSQSNPSLADPDLKRQAALIVFNDYDPNSGVDRRSYCGYYKVVDGIPRNPTRRTGITGRGSLVRWGPNHHADPMFTRWQRDAQGNVVLKSGSPVLEMLVARPTDGAGKHSLPFGAIAPGAVLPQAIFPPHLTEQAAVVESGKRRVQSPTSLEELLANGYMIYKGYVEDALNTDNAWIESVVVNFHDDSGTILTDDVVLAKPGYTLAWTALHEELDILRRQSEWVATLAARREAYFADKIPRVLHNVLGCIEKRGVDVEGLYRLSGSASSIKQLYERIFKDDNFDPAEVDDIHDLTGLVKLVLREMNPPLLTFSLYDDFVNAAGKHPSEQAVAIQEVVQRMPRANFEKMDTLLKHLRLVGQQSAVNKMTLQNLALVFGPTIMRSPVGPVRDLQDSAMQANVTRLLLEASPDSLRNNRRRPTAESLGQQEASKSSTILRLDSRADLNESATDELASRGASPVTINITDTDGGDIDVDELDSPVHAKPPAAASPAKIATPAKTATPTVSTPTITISQDNGPGESTDDFDDDEQQQEPQPVQQQVQKQVQQQPPEQQPLPASPAMAALSVSAAEDDDDDDEDDDDMAYWYMADASRDEIRALRDLPAGSFLVYESRLQQGNFCISVYTGEFIYTGLILRTERGFRLEEDKSTFITLKQLVKHYAANVCQPCECKLHIDHERDAAFKANLSSVKAERQPPTMFLAGASGNTDDDDDEEGFEDFPAGDEEGFEDFPAGDEEGFEDFPDMTASPQHPGGDADDAEGFDELPPSPQPVHRNGEADDAAAATDEEGYDDMPADQGDTLGVDMLTRVPSSVLQLGNACYDEQEAYEGTYAPEGIPEETEEGYYDEEGNFYYYEDEGGFYDEEGNYYYYDEAGNCWDEAGNCYPPEEGYGEQQAGGETASASPAAPAGANTSMARPSPAKPRSRMQRKISQEVVLNEDDLRLIALPTHAKQRAKLSDKINAIETRRAGWLSKRDESAKKESMKKKWNKRWFVLQDTMLKFYKGIPSDTSSAMEYFNICPQTRVVIQANGRFVINSPRKTYMLMASSITEAQEWVRILQNACELARTSSMA